MKFNRDDTNYKTAIVQIWVIKMAKKSIMRFRKPVTTTIFAIVSAISFTVAAFSLKDWLIMKFGTGTAVIIGTGATIVLVITGMYVDRSRLSKVSKNRRRK